MVMVARADAVASSSLKLCQFFCFYLFLFFAFITEARITYDRKTLTNIGN